jgi:hypothetical protein
MEAMTSRTRHTRGTALQRRRTAKPLVADKRLRLERLTQIGRNPISTISLLPSNPDAVLADTPIVRRGRINPRYF